MPTLTTQDLTAGFNALVERHGETTDLPGRPHFYIYFQPQFDDSHQIRCDIEHGGQTFFSMTQLSAQVVHACDQGELANILMRAIETTHRLVCNAVLDAITKDSVSRMHATGEGTLDVVLPAVRKFTRPAPTAWARVLGDYLEAAA